VALSSTLATTAVESLRTRLQGGSFQLWSGDPSAGGTLRTTHAIPGSIDAAANGSVTFTPAAAYPVNITTPVVSTHWRIVDNVGASWLGVFGDLFTAPATLVDGGLVTLGPVSVALPGFEPSAGVSVPLITWYEGTDGDNSFVRESGLSREFSHYSSYLYWEDENTGDWLDANGVAHGTTPYAVLNVPGGTSNTWIEADVTSLVNAWIAGTVDEYHGFKIGPTAGVGFSTNWSSRQGANAPELVIDGATTLTATADSFIDTSTAFSKGQDAVLQTTETRSAFVRFDLSAYDVPITSATLRMYCNAGSNAHNIYAAYPRPNFPLQSVQAGIAASYPGDVGIEADPDVFMVQRFVDSNWAVDIPTWFNGGSPDLTPTGPWVREGGDKAIGEAVTGGTALTGWRVRSGGILECHWNPADPRSQENTRGTLSTQFWTGQRTEAYFRYYVMFGDGNQSELEEGPFICRDAGGKLPGICGRYNDLFGGYDGHPYGLNSGGSGGACPNGNSGWTMRTDYRAQCRDSTSALDGTHTIGEYIYTMDRCQRSGPATMYARGDTTGGVFFPGVWYCVEQYVKINSTTSSSDGRMMRWVDGRLMYDSDMDPQFDGTGVRFYNTNTYWIDCLWNDVYYGGQTVGAVPAYGMSIFLRNMVAAGAPIGMIA
jgi:hypothetical protein